MKKTTFLFLAVLLLLGFYINLQRSKLFVYKIQASNPLSLYTISEIIQQRSQVFYGYIPTIHLDIGKSQIYVEMPNDITPLLGKGEFIGMQNGKKILDNSDLLGANFVGPIKINNSIEIEVLIFLKNGSMEKINLNQPLYIFLDRPKNTALLFNVNSFGNLLVQDQILKLQTAATLINSSLPIFFYSNESQLDLIAEQLKNLRGYTLLYSSPLPEEFKSKLNGLNITLKQENLEPNFVGPNLISWDAIGLKRVINYPDTELQPFLNKSIIGFFEVYPKQQIQKATNQTKSFITLLSTLPLKDVQLLTTIQKTPNYTEFIIFYLAFLLFAFLITKIKKSKIESFIVDAILAISLSLFFGFDEIVYIALLFSLLLPRNTFSIILLAFCLVLSAFTSFTFSAFFITSFSFVLLSFLEKKI
jgi:hypothetical protein